MNIFKKKEVEKEVVEKEDKPISCFDCRCLLHKEDAQKVEHSPELPHPYSIHGFPFVPHWSIDLIYYCQKCRKPYDKNYGYKFYKIIPQHIIEVDEDGHEIKHKK